LEFVDADIEKGEIELAFAATEAFTNPTGNVLGAFQAAMLYDTVGPRSSLRSSPISSNPRWNSACTFYGRLSRGDSSAGGASSTEQEITFTSKRRCSTRAARSSPPQRPLLASFR
jgi:acyl-coenzyme A thioesterase PaaI-like protein